MAGVVFFSGGTWPGTTPFVGQNNAPAVLRKSSASGPNSRQFLLLRMLPLPLLQLFISRYGDFHLIYS